MVKFSDLEKGNLNPEKSQERDREERRQPSHLNFRDLEKKSDRITSRQTAHPNEAGEEERKAIYDAATDYLTGVLDAVRKRQRFTLESGEKIIRRIVEFRSPVDPLLIRAIHQDNPHGFLANHCVNVTVFAVKMAAALGLSKPEQEQVGLAALLHEVGMGVVPEKLIYKEQKLDKQDYALFRKRPEFSHKILKGFGDEYSFLAETALQVHEHMDGSGYPRGLSGGEIHLYAQIIGLVDMYEAMIHSRPQRGQILYFSAMKRIITIGRQRYPKKLLKALLNTFSVFPLYGLVKLNSNAIGRVIQVYPEQPMRPKIEIIFDSQGRRVLTRHVVDLSENSILYIVDSVPEKKNADVLGGPGARQYSHAPASIHYDPDFAVLQDAADADSEVSPDADILEITEDDFEPQPPATERGAATTYAMREPDGFIDDGPVQRAETGRGRWVGRYKWILVAVGIVALAGVLFWQLGRMESPPNQPANKPGVTAKPSKKKVPTGAQSKAKSDKAASIVPKEKIASTPAAPVPSEKEKTVAETDHKNASKEQTPPVPAPLKEPAPPPPKQAPSETPPAPAATRPANETKAATAKVEPVTDTVRVEVAAGPKPAEGAAAAVKARSGSYPFSIKLDSFRTLEEARSTLPAYIAKGLNAYWVKVNLGSQGVWYRIFAGSYPSLQEAEAAISRLELKNAVVRETKYTAFIGMFSSQAEVDQQLKVLSDKGLCPYVVHGQGQRRLLFVGAFYTHKGAAEQVADLQSKGVQSEIFER